VITSSGRIAFATGSRPYKEQVKRLKMEDVTVKGGRVDMRIFQWQPDLDELLWKPSAKWDER
jgi:methylated-DNA-protein-cysteine methyltransferase-like protein